MAVNRTRVGPVTLPLPLSALVVPVVAGIGGAAFLAWKPGVARSMATSPRAAAFTLVVGLVVLGAGWALPRLGRGPLLTAGVQAVPVALAFLLTVAPSFRQVTVDEAFPGRAIAPVPASGSATGAPAGASAAPSGSSGRPAVVGQGSLTGIDHRAEGTVLLVRRPDGSLVVRLADLDVEPGPDYFVHLVPGAGREDPGGSVGLGRLRGNRGNQNYEVPAGTSATSAGSPVTVLIWCRAFAVPVAAATIG